MKTCNDNLVYFSDLSKIDYKITGKLDLVPVVSELDKDYEVTHYFHSVTQVTYFHRIVNKSKYK